MMSLVAWNLYFQQFDFSARYCCQPAYCNSEDSLKGKRHPPENQFPSCSKLVFANILSIPFYLHLSHSATSYNSLVLYTFLIELQDTYLQALPFDACRWNSGPTPRPYILSSKDKREPQCHQALAVYKGLAGRLKSIDLLLSHAAHGCFVFWQYYVIRGITIIERPSYACTP